MHLPRTIAIAFLLLLLSATSADAAGPGFEFTTEESFDAQSLGSYQGNHEDIYKYIDQNLDDHLIQLQRWVRQPSISAQSVGIVEMAELVKGDLVELGFKEASLVPSSGHPGVWGFYDAGAEKTLMIYMMYDVQPVNPEDWQTPPFAGNLVDTPQGKALMARGATNQKGPERAFLNALEAIIKVTGNLPVNLMVLAEGEEELGSPNYPELVDQYEARLKTADGAFFPFNSQSLKGSMSMSLGVKGIVYFEMESRGGSWGGPRNAEIHGSYKALVDSPVLRLVKAISSLTTPDGNTITVRGYYEGIIPPTLEEQQIMNSSLAHSGQVEQDMKDLFGIDRFIDDVSGRDRQLKLLYDPTLNVDGIWAGYTGEGVKTILPHLATAKMDSRLPPDLDPDISLQKIRTHLDQQGFEDIVIRKLSGYPASQMSVSSPLVQSTIRVFNKWVPDLKVNPRLAGSAPFYQFTSRLGIPLVFNGLGHGSGAHAPNEYMLIYPNPDSSIAGLADIEKSYVDLIFSFAATGSKSDKD